LLGRGGFAEVYAARDVRLKREVAVKTLRYDFHASPLLLERFRREAEAMAQLRHPNIMPIYTVGESDGLAYFVMPLIHGETLGQRAKREGKLPLDEVRRILFEAASALHHAHRAGMIHRDVKPDNILLEGDERRVLVTDLGIARAAQPEDGQGLTGTGMLLGTPDYMSPEQASAEAEVDHRSDLYSLGVVAYQMLTGELPFRAATFQGLIVRLISEEAPSVTLGRPDCPADLAEAVTRCLAKEPDDRYASAGELCALLRPQTTGGYAVPRATGVRAAIRTMTTLPVTPVARFRRTVAVFALGNAALLAIDLATNKALDFAPLIAALWLLPVAFRYGRLWTTGYTPRDILRGGDSPPSGSVSTETSGTLGSRSGAFGTHVDTVQRVRSERAVIAGLVTNLPRSERDRIPGVVGSADRIVARVRALARQLGRLDRLLEEGERDDGGHTRSTPQQRSEVESRQVALQGELRVAEAVIEELRVAIERAATMGVSASRTDLEVAITKADACGRSRA
jgi:serine/threonine-protein kinase